MVSFNLYSFIITSASPMRRPLADRVINTLQVLPIDTSMDKPRIGQKRPFWTIVQDEDEVSLAKHRNMG